MMTDSYSLIPTSTNVDMSLKFVLYLKNKEINAVNKMLKDVLSSSRKAQMEWVTNYGEMVDFALDKFVDDSNIVLDKITLDDEVMELSQDLVNSLKDAVTSVDFILGRDQHLNG